MKKIKQNIKTVLVLAGLIILGGCSTDDLDPTLAQKKSVEGSINSVNNLYGLIKGAHNVLTAAGYYGRDAIATNEVRSDNCFSNGNSGRFSTQAEFKYNNTTDFIWNNAYYLIANVNIIINTDLGTLSGDHNKGKHIQGQALILRALGHYDLLRTFGQQHAATSGNLGVPIVKQFKGEEFPARNTITEVKNAIYEDLENAFAMMDKDFDTSKVFVSKYSAKALESRVAIYFGDWERARDAAKEVIDNGGYTIVPGASFVSSWTTKENTNSIFELAFASDDALSSNSLQYIYRFPSDAPAGYGDVEVESSVINIFEATDVRRGILGYQDAGTRLRNMGKYPDTATGTDNIPLIRYEEVVLNYAEALFELNNADPMALTNLNLITSNRGASAYATATKDNILLERRKELMFEGFRFDDMMRTGKDVVVLGSNKNVIETLTYPNDKFVYPIDIAEMDANSNMVQNAGY